MCKSPWRRISGCKGRGAFYEEVGAIRDVVQNHLLQVDGIAGHGCAGRPRAESHAGGEIAHFPRHAAARSEGGRARTNSKAIATKTGVAKDSQVETFAALRLHIDTWRWADVPFYIRAGKCLPITATEVTVTLKRPPLAIFDPSDNMPANYFRLRLSPEVVIGEGALVKRNGEHMRGEPVELVARHNSQAEKSPYERLLGDAIRGDTSLFTQDDCVEAAWRVVDPVLDGGAAGAGIRARHMGTRRRPARSSTAATPGMTPRPRNPRRAERPGDGLFCWTSTTPCWTTTASPRIWASGWSRLRRRASARVTGPSSRRCARQLGLADYLGACRSFAPGSTTIRNCWHVGVSAGISVCRAAVSAGARGDRSLAHARAGRVVLSDGDIVFQPRKIQRSGIWDAVEGRVMIYVHKEKVLDHMQRRYPAKHYVMVDDKPNLLAAMKSALGA